MANRSFQNQNYSMIKRMVALFADFTVSEAVTPVPTLNKWNYPTFGAGPNSRTYTAAPLASTLPTGAPYPLQYSAGAEGVLSIARTAAGQYTLKLQDNYQRLVGLNAWAATATGTPVFAICTENTTISSYSPTTPGAIIGLAFWDFAAAAVDPIGHVRVQLILADATEP